MTLKEWSAGNNLRSTEKISFAPLLDEDDDLEHQRASVQTPSPNHFLDGNKILFIASLCCLIASVALYVRTVKDDNLVRQTTFYSPFLDTFTPEWRPDTFNTHPIDSEQSIYRQDPSDEVDAAWERISKIGVLAISSEDVRRLGKDPSTVIQAPESWNLGSDAHLAHLDGLHLLHCLDAMRKSLHENFDRYYPNGTPAVHHTHLSHCQEALAKHLMCQPSVELITYSWVQEREHPFPDFDITKKCYGVDQLLDWQNEHQVEGMDRARWNTLRQPEDITPLVPPVLALEALNETRAKEELLR